MKFIPTCPPVAKLAAALNIPDEQARAIRAHIKSGYSVPRGEHPSHAVAAFLEPLNKLVETHGVESLYPEKPSRWYLNAGDTYATTLIFNDETDTFRLGCWGDLAGA